ncbi:hypothetical protein RYZ45_25085 [Citrobacter portucalensis]|nr:hypothetical protein [Citrobacter portucalensis]MDW2651499.1 hypothetical protein [Citrobacter portucalensis]
MPENPASYRVVRTKSYLFNKAQKMVESHQKMMGNNTVSTTVPSTSYAAMNEHERAAVAHEFMNNGQSGPHQAMAEAHRRMINAG